MTHQPVDQGRGQGVVHVKDFAPLPERSIRGDHDRTQFITGGDNLEHQVGPLLVDGQIDQLIEEEKTRKHETLDGYALMYHLAGNETKNDRDFLAPLERKRKSQG